MHEDPINTDDNDGLTVWRLTADARRVQEEEITSALRVAGPSFGQAKVALEDHAKGVDPITLMGAMAMYFGAAEIGTNPEHNRSAGIYQHHLELIQAVLLRCGPIDANRRAPYLDIPDMTEAVKEFVDAWIFLEAKKIENAPEGPKRDRARVLCQLRVGTAFRRGSGYVSRLLPMLEESLTPLDDACRGPLGFAPSVLPKWWMAVLGVANRRLDEHRSQVQEALSWPLDSEWFTKVTDRFGTLPGAEPERVVLLASLDDDQRRGFVMHSSDLRAHEIFRFTLDQLVELMPEPVPAETVRSIIDSWSLTAGSAGEINIDRLVIENPVVTHPFVAADGCWYLFCGWLLLHNPFELIERVLIDSPELFEAYMTRRADFLERRTAELLSTALPGAAVERSLLVTDPTDGKQYENDVVAHISTYVIAAEAKAGRLPAEARRGQGRQLRDRIDELLVKPSEQALRLARRLEHGDTSVPFTRKVDGSELTIEASEVRRTLTLGVTLEPLAGLLPRLAEVAEAELSTLAGDALAYSLNLLDLEIVVDLLDHPSEVLHYLTRRTEIERRQFLTGDEVDLLALYLQTGFNLGEHEFEEQHHLDVTGLSHAIDVWHYRREAGLPADRPRMQRTDWWERLLSLVEERCGPRWAEIGVSLCNVADYDQRNFEDALHRLRREIAAGDRPATDVVLLQNGPPQRRDVFIGLIAAFRDAGQRAQQYRDAASSVFATHPTDRVLVLAWTPVPIEPAYFALALLDNVAGCAHG